MRCLALVLAGSVASAAAAAEPAAATERRTVALAGARLAHPQGVAGSIGALFARVPAGWDCTTPCEFRGFLVQAEPGVRGAQLSAGWALVIGETTRGGRYLTDVIVGFGIKTALLRTWADAPVEPAAQTLVGVEGEFTVTRVNFRLGVFRSSHPDPDDRVILTGGLGWGF
jgi:hypothetical protein